MLKVTLWHEPEGHVFLVVDSGRPFHRDSYNRNDLDQERICVSAGVVAIKVVSEFSEIPIEVEFERFEPELRDLDLWDCVKECSIEVSGKSLRFESVLGDEFGELEVGPGNFRFRIYYGGQDTLGDDGSTTDYYLLQIWPSTHSSTKCIKRL